MNRGAGSAGIFRVLTGSSSRYAQSSDSLLPWLIVCFFLAALLSCKTIPELPDAVQTESGFVPLESGASAYIFADVKNAKPVLELINIPELDDKQTQNMLDRTQSALIALYPQGNERRLQLAAWGSYPARGAELALGLSREWKKIKPGAAAGASYWYSPTRRLSLALSPKQAVAVFSSDEVPREPFAATPGVELPEGFAEFRRNAALACWLENPASLINQKLREMNVPMELPAERIFVSVFPVAEQAGGQAPERRYQTLIRIQLASATQAKALATLFTFAQNFISPQTDGAVSPTAAPAAILFTNPPTQDGRNLNIKTAPLSEKETALLFQLFSL